MTQNFQKAKIYKITNDYNDEIYIGSTCDTLIKRFSSHKYDSKKINVINRPIYKLMNEIGIDRFRIDLIEDYPCNDKQALRQREGHFIREISTLNMNIAGRTKKEYQMNWNKENKDKLLKQKKKWKEENKEIVNERDRKYYQENKENYKQYRKENSNTIKEYQREYRQRKKLEKENVAI